jgi:Mn2+/Fe2+ NRAMP family transporter
VVAFGVICIVATVFMNYAHYVTVMKWLTLTLFAYVAALFAAPISWGEALVGTLIPRITWSSAFFTTLVAIFGTTISPYLFFWQASQEAEDQRVNPHEKPLLKAPEQALVAFERIRADTLVGMAFSNIIALAIIITTAATLHKAGITAIETSAQAAEALRPIAGDFAFIVFALGIIGTGLLAVAGSRRLCRLCHRRSMQMAGRACQKTRPGDGVLFDVGGLHAPRHGYHLDPDRSDQSLILERSD